ncbi:MAG: hypothetical protein NT104_03370 [Bacteroidetes bacterium]|nr:hypothetical protein [Bacteroidota bacterium]
MNRLKTSTNLRLMVICLVAFSLVSASCTSLQEAGSMASDDLYTTPNLRNTVSTNKKVVTTEDWSSPNRIQNNASTQENNTNNQANASADNEEYQDYQNYQDDRYLRLKVANRNRWSSIDDWGYWNDPRFNNAFYPSYLGWNSWYTGYYGASWYYPFGPSYTMGWGGYNPYSSFGGYGMGWGFNNFGYDPFGYGGFGYGGFGYGGYGFGYGGWNPYFVGLWNPYRPYYHGGNFNPGYGNRGNGDNRQQQIATRSMQNSAVGLGAYRNNRGYNNSNNAINNNNNNVNLRNTVNPNANSNFGSLIKRVVTNNANVNNSNGGNGYDRPARYFSNNNNNSGSTQNRANYSAPAQSNNSSNSGGRSGGFNSSGTSTSAPRPSRGQNP